MRDVYAVLPLIPADAVLGAQNPILPHVSTRHVIYLTDTQGPIDYLVFDSELDGWPLSHDQLVAKIDALQSDPCSRLVAVEGTAYLFQRLPCPAP